MEKLKFNLAILYPVTCIFKRGRTPKTVWMKDIVPVEIPSVAAGDVKEAVNIAELGTSGKFWRRHTRMALDGVLYGPHQGMVTLALPDNPEINFDREHAMQSMAICAENAWVTGRMLTSTLSKRREIWPGRITPGVDAIPLNVDIIVENGRDAVREQVAKITSEMLFVDGALWERGGAPMITVIHPLTPKQDTHCCLEHRFGGWCVLFSPLRLNEALQFTRELRVPRIKKGEIFTGGMNGFDIEKYDEALIGPLRERELNTAAAVARIIEALEPHIPGSLTYQGSPLSPDGCAAVSRLGALKETALLGDPAASDHILMEIEALQNANFHVGETKDAKILRRASMIAVEGIRRSPAAILNDEDSLRFLTP